MKRQDLDSKRQLADYAAAFDFLGRLSGAMNEVTVVENVFELFSSIFAPKTMIYLPIRGDAPGEVISRSSVPFDVEAARSRMLRVTDHAWTPSGEGFDIRLGHGAAKAVIQVEGVQFVEYRSHYLNLALSMLPVIDLALTNARNFQLLLDEQAKLRTAVRARERVLAFVSHDLRSPLSSIKLNAELLERRHCSGAADERSCKYARSIRRSAERMNRLIDDLLDIGKLEAGVFRVRITQCSAEDLLSEALRELRPQAEKKGVRFEERCRGSTLLPCDRDRIVQVLSNLAGNALKFAPEQVGSIAVELEEREDDFLFTVSDNGPGIWPDEISRLCDVYWQGREGKQGGAGLGLAIARGIVDAHEGDFWVESAPGKGASFYFTIPRAGPTGVESAPAGPAGGQDGSAQQRNPVE